MNHPEMATVSTLFKVSTQHEEGAVRNDTEILDGISMYCRYALGIHAAVTLICNGKCDDVSDGWMITSNPYSSGKDQVSITDCRAIGIAEHKRNLKGMSDIANSGSARQHYQEYGKKYNLQDAGWLNNSCPMNRLIGAAKVHEIHTEAQNKEGIGDKWMYCVGKKRGESEDEGSPR